MKRTLIAVKLLFALVSILLLAGNSFLWYFAYPQGAETFLGSYSRLAFSLSQSLPFFVIVTLIFWQSETWSAFLFGIFAAILLIFLMLIYYLLSAHTIFDVFWGGQAIIGTAVAVLFHRISAKPSVALDGEDQ